MGGRAVVEAAATVSLPGTGEGDETLDAGTGTDTVGDTGSGTATDADAAGVAGCVSATSFSRGTPSSVTSPMKCPPPPNSSHAATAMFNATSNPKIRRGSIGYRR